jgi:hypothetical protein
MGGYELCFATTKSRDLQLVSNQNFVLLWATTQRRTTLVLLYLHRFPPKLLNILNFIHLKKEFVLKLFFDDAT